MGAGFNEETIRKRDTTNYHGCADTQRIIPRFRMNAVQRRDNCCRLCSPMSELIVDVIRAADPSSQNRKSMPLSPPAAPSRLMRGVGVILLLLWPPLNIH